MDTHLVNILNLSQLQDVLQRVVRDSYRDEWEVLREVHMVDGTPRPRRPDGTREPSEYDIWLDDHLTGRRHDEVKSFIEAVFSVLRYSRKTGGPFNPTWVTAWEKFEPYIGSFKAGGMYTADRWNQVVGVGTTGNQWQIVLKYPARKAGMIFRPTQLDGGFYAYHFPSPVTAGMGLGGHPMDLSGPGPTQGLLPEYIHEQIEPDIRYWEDAGRLIGRTAGEPYSLTRLRRRHYERLKGHYQGVAEWMQSPV